MKWKMTSLEECTEYITDGDHQPAPKSEEGIRFIKIKDIKNNKISFDDALYVPLDYYEHLADDHKAKRNDILYTVVGSFGIPAFVDFDMPFCFERNIALLHPNKNIIPQFLYYVLKSDVFYQQVLGVANGAAQKLIPLKKLKALTFLIPPLVTQQRIVNILSAYDNLIENNQKQIKLQEEATQRLYKEWFVDLSFPGHEETPIVDGVPEGWKKVSINELGNYINGYAFKPSDWRTVGKPIIKIKEMNEGITESTPRNPGDGIPEKYFVSAGDILFSWSATLSAIIWGAEDGLLNQHLFKVIPNEGYSREFVLQSILLTLDEFKNLTTGATMKHIQRGKLKDVFVNVPPTGIMQKYGQCGELLRSKILNLANSNSLLIEARDRLLPKLMSGELEV